jgi:hypothetical protein
MHCCDNSELIVSCSKFLSMSYTKPSQSSAKAVIFCLVTLKDLLPQLSFFHKARGYHRHEFLQSVRILN